MSKMREIASKGYSHPNGQLTVAECNEVVDFVEGLAEADAEFLILHGFPTRLQHKNGDMDSDLTWKKALQMTLEMSGS